MYMCVYVYMTVHVDAHGMWCACMPVYKLRVCVCVCVCVCERQTDRQCLVCVCVCIHVCVCERESLVCVLMYVGM